MRHSKSLLTPAQCLLQALCPLPQRPFLCRRLIRQSQASLSISARRPAQGFFVNRNIAAGVNGKGPRVAVKEKDRLSDLVKDNDIEAPAGVQMVLADGKLGPVQDVAVVLRTLNGQDEHLVQVSPPTEHRPTAVVKVFKRADLIRQKLEREKAAKKQQKSTKDRASKQMELNWAIGPHDLEMKLGQLEGFLGKGRTVEIILAAKRRQRRASPEEGEEVLKKIRDLLQNIDAREIKPMDGEVLKQAILTVKKRGVD